MNKPLNQRPAHRNTDHRDTEIIPAVPASFGVPKIDTPTGSSTKPVPLVVFLAFLVACAGVTWGVWESGASLSWRIITAALAVALVLLSASNGIKIRRSRG